MDLIGSDEDQEYNSDDQRFEQMAVEMLWKGKKNSSFIKDGPVVLDVGGDKFTTSRKKLVRFPNTRWNKQGMASKSLHAILKVDDLIKIDESYFPCLHQTR